MCPIKAWSQPIVKCFCQLTASEWSECFVFLKVSKTNTSSLRRLSPQILVYGQIYFLWNGTKADGTWWRRATHGDGGASLNIGNGWEAITEECKRLWETKCSRTQSGDLQSSFTHNTAPESDDYREIATTWGAHYRRRGVEEGHKEMCSSVMRRILQWKAGECVALAPADCSRCFHPFGNPFIPDMRLL